MYAVTIFRHQKWLESFLVTREEAHQTARKLREHYPRGYGYRVEVTRYDS